ncbi:hypothetical protein K523DRAFT_372860 [Schizophyllum commune Tattone D]|nr:hypothetical protein K523DRAFT_372860 [Schizophyllum commune Tattone D]
MPPSILSSSISTQKDMDALSIINYRLINLDTGYYRRQMEHFEYYWGMEKGTLDLSTPLNHIQLRSDMAERMDNSEWAILPTKKTLDTIKALTEYNTTAGMKKRKHFTEELPEQEYEYDFLPLCLTKRDRPSLYLKRGSTVRTIKKAYSKIPRIRSRAHPLFVIFHANRQILSGSSHSDAKAEQLIRSMSALLHPWDSSPPVEFTVGPDVWQKHRHPSSDDGSVARAQLKTCNTSRAQRPERAARKSTRAPSPQLKHRQDRPSIYDHARRRPSPPKSAVLPRSARASESGSSDSAVDVNFSPTDLRDWLESISPKPKSKSKNAYPPSPKCDAVLARYRKESAREPRNALRVTLMLTTSGLVGGGNSETSRSIYCSNDWAMNIYDKCLWSSNPPEDAQFDYIDLIP